LYRRLHQRRRPPNPPPLPNQQHPHCPKDSGEYKVSGELRIGPAALLDYYVKYFQDNGWEEDMVMEQEGIVVVSFKKGGHLQYVDAREGGIGMKITITTGQG
jgi:hypothetical protein